MNDVPRNRSLDDRVTLLESSIGGMRSDIENLQSNLTQQGINTQSAISSLKQSIDTQQSKGTDWPAILTVMAAWATIIIGLLGTVAYVSSTPMQRQIDALGGHLSELASIVPGHVERFNALEDNHEEFKAHALRESDKHTTDIHDLDESLQREMRDLIATLRAELDGLRAETDAKDKALDAALQREMRMIADKQGADVHNNTAQIAEVKAELRTAAARSTENRERIAKLEAGREKP